MNAAARPTGIVLGLVVAVVVQAVFFTLVHGMSAGIGVLPIVNLRIFSLPSDGCARSAHRREVRDRGQHRHHRRIRGGGLPRLARVPGEAASRRGVTGGLAL